jgi:multiple sugar transport system substrate-binding protein
MKAGRSTIGRREFLQLAAAAFAGSVLTSCAQPAAEEGSADEDEATPVTAPSAQDIVVTQWCFPLLPDDMELFGPMIEVFEEENAGISVEVELFPWNSRAQRLMSAMAGGAVGDVAYLNGDNYSQFADLNAMYPLDDAVVEAGLKEDMKPGALEALTWKGSLYVAPILQTCSPPYFNRTMVVEAGLDPEAPPETWDDFLTWMNALTVDASGNHPGDSGFDRDSVKQWGAAEPLLASGLWFLWNPWFYQAGGEFLTEDMTQSAISSDAGRDALEMLVTLYDNYVDPADKGLDSTTAFGDQRAACMWSAEQHHIRSLQEEHPELDFFLGDILTKEKRLAHGTVAGYGVFSQSEHPAEAAKWVATLTNQENTKTFDVTLKFISPRSSIDEEVKEGIGDPEFAKAIDQSQFTRENLVHPLTQSMMKLVLPHVQGAVLHEKDVDQALVDAEKAVNDLLATYSPPPED